MARTDTAFGVSFYNRKPEFFQINSHNHTELRKGFDAVNFFSRQRSLFHELILGGIVC